IRFDDLKGWFAAGAVTQLSLTGSDFYVAEGTDLTLLLKTAEPDAVEERLLEWASAAEDRHGDFEDRAFNYRGVRIHARYTPDRTVSSFAVRHDDWMIVSNSHVGIRRVVDVIHKRLPALIDAPDYRYVTALHPPAETP